MLVMTYSQARQNFSSFLDRAKEDGEAMVTRSDGTEFKVIPVQKQKQSVSPFAKIKPVSIKEFVSMQEIIGMMHESWDERSDKIIAAASGESSEKYFGILK